MFRYLKIENWVDQCISILPAIKAAVNLSSNYLLLETQITNTCNKGKLINSKYQTELLMKTTKQTKMFSAVACNKL
jgi:hypothetical protein